MTMQRWDPWGNMRSLRSAMDDLLERSFISARWGEEGIGTGFPVDVSETESEVRVRASLPGIKPEDLDISVQGDLLTIRGETREETSSSGENWHRREIRSGSFARSFSLPSDVDSDACEANFENGILELRLPKREEAKPRKIEVGGAREAIPATMRSESTEQTSTYQAPAQTSEQAETTSSTGTGGQPTSGQSVAGSETSSPGGSPAAVQSEPRYEQQPGVDETPAEDPFGLREEERRGDLT
jgi:HSP20 family protein